MIFRRSVFVQVFFLFVTFSCSPSGGRAAADGGNDGGRDYGDSGNTVDADVDGDSGVPGELGPGIYAVQGADAHGAYAGTAEIREDGRVICLQEWTDFTFEGLRVARAFEGRVASWNPVRMETVLKTAQFIRSWQGNTRPEGVNPPVTCSASFVETGPAAWSGSWECEGRADAAFTETWTWQGPSGSEPIWENRRRMIPAHDPVPASRKNELFSLYASFHALDAVAPYTGRSDFQEAMHYWVHDPTDLEYYRQDTSRVRVIQGIVDPIALREARQRRDAFSTDIHQKQAIFEAEAPVYFINELGMMVDWNENAQTFVDSGDSMLWTGLYAASQAMRYLVTGDAAAFANMLRSIDGQMLCHDITGVPGDFARTVRVHAGIPAGDWMQGQGAYAGIDYLRGANNDMLKGYFVGFLWAGIAMKRAGGEQTRINRMIAILNDLKNNFYEITEGSINKLYTVMLLYFLMDCDGMPVWNANYTQCLRLENDYETLFQANRPWLVDQGNGAMWEYGTSDWSGNHLGIQTMLGLYVMSTIFDGELTGELRDGLREACERVRYVNQGLYQMVCGALGSFETPPPEIEASLWFMQQYTAPKASITVDRRIDPDFSLSPFPNLPWKNDWTTTDRTQSLRAYPLFEMTMDSIMFKANPFTYRSFESGIRAGGIDYLFMYWFGRWAGVIQ